MRPRRLNRDDSRRIRKGLSENRLGEGDSPILLRGLRKIGTVPDGSRIDTKPAAARRVWRGIEDRMGVKWRSATN